MFFRDVYKNKSELYRDNTWNVDHKVFDFLVENGVEDIFYCVERVWVKLGNSHKSGRIVYKITVSKIKKLLEKGQAYEEKLNNHTQIFIPKQAWFCEPPESHEVKKIGRRWINNEIDVEKKIEVKPEIIDISIPAKTFVDAYKQMLAKKNPAYAQ